MHTTSVYIAREQFIRHQTVERTQARSEDFHTHVVRALLHMCVFMKFKSSCTVVAISKGRCNICSLMYKTAMCCYISSQGILGSMYASQLEKGTVTVP